MKSLYTLTFAACAALTIAAAQTPAPSAKPQPSTPKAAPATKPPAAAPAPAPAVTVAPDAVVLTIGDEKMTRAQYEAFVAALPDQLRNQSEGPNKRKFAEQLSEMKAFAAVARRRKMDEKPEVKQRIALQMDNLLASELLRSIDAVTKIDPAAVSAYYEEHKSEFEEAKASHILIRFKGSQVPVREGQKDLTPEEALEKATAIRDKLTKGADFAALAKAESDDVGSGAQGGSLGSFGHGRMIPEFEKVAFTLPVGEISQPVKTAFGYHIIKVEGRTAKTLAEVKPQVESKLKPEVMQKAAEEVRKTIPVTIDDQYFGK